MGPSGWSERALIADIFAPLTAQTPGALNLKDDAAFLTPPKNKDLIITTDAIVAGVHFLGSDPADTIAAKALRVNLSDLAAKGAEPLGYTLSLALTKETRVEWVREFAHGLARDQLEFGISLYGGDTVNTPGPLSVSITAFGTVDTGCMVLRSGAKVGDYIYVTGTIGDGALGLNVALDDGQLPLDAMSEDHKQYLLQRYRCPQPRCALVPALTKFASAALDISDGLIGDIGALTAVSGVSAEIDLSHIPLSPAVQHLVVASEKLMHKALTGGDDYEIVCTIAPKFGEEFETLARRCDVAVSKIGVITAGEHPPKFFDSEANQIEFANTRYEHFPG